MGVYLRFLRPGRVLEASLIGFALVIAVSWRVSGWRITVVGSGVYAWRRGAGLRDYRLRICCVSALPVWLLLAPRDYLSAFIKARRDFFAGGRNSCSCGPTCRCRR